LDLVDPEGGRGMKIAALREGDREAQDRALQLHLPDLLANCGTGRLAVTGLAGLRDRQRVDLRRDVRRSPEELAVAMVRLHVGEDGRVGLRDGEERVVRARDLPVRREEAVRAEQRDVALACRLQLLAERLGLRRKL